MRAGGYINPTQGRPRGLAPTTGPAGWRDPQSGLYPSQTSLLSGGKTKPGNVTNTYSEQNIGSGPESRYGPKSLDEMSVIKESRRLEVDEYTRGSREALGFREDEDDETRLRERTSTFGEEDLDDSQTVSQIATKLGREEGVLSQTLKPDERRAMDESQKLDDEAEFLEREARKEEATGDLGRSENLKQKAITVRGRAMKMRESLGTNKNFGY